MVSGEKPSDLTNRHLSSFKQLVISFSKQNKTKQCKTKKKNKKGKVIGKSSINKTHFIKIAQII